MKVIAYYLPQFHEIKENNEWWGEGFTEWVNVKNARPLFPGHDQPRIPLGQNYYNLLDDDVKRWQAKLAKDNGIYGFCIYHYWFNGHLLLEKPIEQLLANKSIDIHFCLCWANENWTTQWVDAKSKILMEQGYGGKEEWVKHFNYFQPFFEDDRYIKENNSPLLVIYRPEIIEQFTEMITCWKEMAKQHGFSDLIILNQASNPKKIQDIEKSIDYNIEFQPDAALYSTSSDNRGLVRIIGRKIKYWLKKIIPLIEWDQISFTHMDFWLDYDKVWNKILQTEPYDEKSIAGAFVDYDSTPRKGRRGHVFYNASPDKFRKYFAELVLKVKEKYQNDYIFLFAWNEWGEGGYLEPDESSGYEYLSAIKDDLG